MLAERLAAAVDGLHPRRRVLVAVDGPDAAGKTTLADAVAVRLRRPVVRVSIDGWHHPREVRLARGDESPEGYYRDSFDVEALVTQCLVPFREGATPVRTAAFSHETDERSVRRADVETGSVLLVDGVFLLRPELRDLWDLAVYLHVPDDVTVARALVRDAALMGGDDRVRSRYARRYLPGQALYRQEADPIARADVLVDNSDPESPLVLRWAVSPR